MAGLDATRACLETIGEWGRVFGILFFGRSKKVIGPSPVITSRRNTNMTHFPFAAGQRGGNRARAIARDACERGAGNLPRRCCRHRLLCRQNISEVVPVEEPLTSEHVQDIKDGGAILLHLMNGGRGGGPGQGEKGVPVSTAWPVERQGGTKASPRTPWSYHGKDQEGLDRNTWDEAFA